MSNRPSRIQRKQVYVHKIQKVYAVALALMLLSYSLVIFAIAFIVPYLVPAIKFLSTSIPEKEASAATQMLWHVQNSGPALLKVAAEVWPVLVALIVAVAIFSVYFTHRLAGPLYRFQRSASELAEGNLSLRIRLRNGDHLQDLADIINQAIGNMERAMIDIRDRVANSRETILSEIETLRAQSSGDRAEVDKLESTVIQCHQEIDEIVKRHRLSDSAR